MKRVLCWSAGKDSTATGILAKINKEPIDEILCVLPDPFKAELELIKNFESFMGMKVTIVKGPSFEDYFFKLKGKRSPHCGTIYGWPFTMFKTCARVLKWEPLKSHFKNENVCFLLGIAKNENRKILEPNESLLIKYGLTEDDARALCKERGLLNPLYEHFKILGCVRCPKQPINSIRKMKELEPEKFKWCVENDFQSPVKFKPKHTFNEFINKHGI